MPGKDSMRAYLELEARLNGFPEVQRALEGIKDIAINLDSSGLKDMAKQMGGVSKIFRDLSKDSQAIGLDLKDQLKNAQKSLSEGLSKTYDDMFTLQKQMLVAQGVGDTARVDSIKKQMEEVQGTINEQMKSATDSLKVYREIVSDMQKEDKAREKQKQKLEEAKRAVEEANKKGLADKMENMTQGFESMWGKIKTKDLPGLFKDLGKSFGAMAKKGAAEATVAKAKGEAPTGLGAMAPELEAVAVGLGTLAAGIAAVAAVVGVIAAVVGALNALDKKLKDYNKTILEGSSWADMYWSGQNKSVFELSDGLDVLMKATTDFGNNAMWRTTSDEQVKMINAFQNAGWTIKEMTKDLDNADEATKRLQEATGRVQTYALLLGQSNEEIAKDMAEYMENLGMSQEEVSAGFSSIYRAAMDSGFGVKRFYSMVQQATAGIALYNVRIDEAAGVLKVLGKSLSPKVAGEFMQGLTKGLSDKSYQDRIKEIMVVGVENTRKYLARDAENMATDFSKDFSAELAGLGIHVNSGDGKALLDKLQHMNAEDQSRLIAQLQKGNEQAGQRMFSLMDIAKGAKDGSTEGEMAIASGQATMTTKLQMALTTFSGKPLSELTAVELMGQESLRGMSTEQIEYLRRVDKSLQGQYRELTSGNVKVATTQEEMAQQLKDYGALVQVQNGKYVAMEGILKDNKVIVGKQLDSAMDLAGVSGSTYDLNEEAMSADQAHALQMVKNTRQLSSLIEMGTNALLLRIAGLVNGIWKKMGGSEKSQEAMEKSDQLVKDITAGMETKQQELGQLQLEAASAVSEQQLKDIQEKMAPIEASLEASKKLVAFQQEYQQALAMTDSPEKALAHMQKQGTLAQYGLETLGGKGMLAAKQEGQAKAQDKMLKIDAVLSATGGLLFGDKSIRKLVTVEETNKAQFEAIQGSLEAQVAGDAVQGGVLDDQLTTEKKALTESEKQTTAAEKTAKLLEEQQKAADLTNWLSSAGYAGPDVGSLATGGARGDPAAMARLGEIAKGLGPGSEYAQAQAAGLGIPLSDFIYRKGGQIHPIDTQDDVVGYKPQGPIDGLIGARGSGVVNITINGGDQAEVYNTVKRALKTSGLRA